MIKLFFFIIEIFAYGLPTYISICYLLTNVANVKLVSFSCLLLDFKFLSFFRLFEKYNMYFSIIIKVAKKLIYFLVFLVILVFSFAHAFYILLRPTSPFSLDEPTINDDPNNPWNLVPSYYQMSKDGTIASTFIQAPDENTNMFTNYGNALYAMYLFLIGIIMIYFFMHLKYLLIIKYLPLLSF